MTNDSFEIRPMSRTDVDFALSLAEREGWGPGLDDADSFYRTDPDGFFVGLLDGRPMGCISAVSYGGTFGFIGLYIVVPEQRGRGYGIRLWNAAMDRLAGHNVGLDGVVEMQPDYRKSGFRLAHRNIRFKSRAQPAGTARPGVVDLKSVDFRDLCAYDRPLFPAGRETFLCAWTDMPHAKGLARVENGALAGYGVIRACRNAYKIGPLFADDEATAEILFQSLSGHAEAGAPVYLDAPETNPIAMALARRHGMETVFETARMYTREEPNIAMNRVFGITTFELG
jgi:GNAT superfamily N-acetyltransferase